MRSRLWSSCSEGSTGFGSTRDRRASRAASLATGIAFALLSTACAADSAEPTAADLAGTWVWAGLGSEPPADGGPERFAQEIVLRLTAEGDLLGGDLESPLLRLPLQGQRRGDEVGLIAGTRERGLPLGGRVAGDRLELYTSFPGRAELLPVTLRRATEAEKASLPKPIQPLPLPPLRELPDDGQARTPPMGWNSWNHFKTEIDDATIRSIADAMVASGMRDAGYVYVNIDDGWQGRRDASGQLRPNARFPDMKALADYVHAKGLKLGIYTSPGPRSCAQYEGSLGHEEQDARTFAAWGIDYLKYDWCSARALYSEAEMRGVYQKMGEALRATGRKIVYSLCQYGLDQVWHWGPKVGGHLWRTTGDISDDWRVMAWIGFSQNELAPFAGPGRWNDPDMLEVGNGAMSATEYRTHMSLWALLAAPLLAGNDLRSMSPETIEILTHPEVIAIDQDPLGRQGSRIASPSPTTEVWARPLADGRQAVGLFNRGELPAKVEVRWQDLGREGPQPVRDVWARRDLEPQTEAYATDVPPHGVALLLVGRARGPGR